MPGIKELKTRIKSVGSTRKITRAMQLVSAAKMRKAQNATLQSRSYASLAWGMIESLEGLGEVKVNVDTSLKSSTTPTSSPSRGGGTSKIGVVLLTSNRGLVGSLNTNLGQKLIEINGNSEILAEIISYGKKGQTLAARLKKNIVADFPKFDRTISIEDIYPIAKFVSDAYNTGKYEKILIVYNHFVSTLVQRATIKQLLPFSDTNDTNDTRMTRNEKDSSQIYQPQSRQPINGHATGKTDTTTIFEPSPRSVINHLIPRIIESQIYQAILESDASEHSARMIMMKNATEAAGDLISDLTLTFNQLRQNKITTELAEITAGKIALE